MISTKLTFKAIILLIASNAYAEEHFVDMLKLLEENQAATDCFNVSNNCYNFKRKRGQTISASIKSCKDVSWY